MVSSVTLRLQNPECFVNPEWTKESPAEQGTRVVSKLYQKSISDDDDTENELFPSFTFTFFFYLLNCVLKDGGEVVGKDVETQSKAIILISAHSEMRSDGEDIVSIYLSLLKFILF